MTLQQQQEYLVRNRTFLFLPCYCVHSLIATNRIIKPFMALQQQREYLVCNLTFPFLPYYCVHSPIATNRITKPFMALQQHQEYLVYNRRFPFLPCYCVHSPIATNRIAMRFAVCSAPPFRYRTKRTDYSKGGIWSGSQPQAEFGAAHCRKKRQTHFIRACRFIFINITLSNRIVKPNNRYTR